jgi:type II secretory pathway pseudopilin PulG
VPTQLGHTLVELLAALAIAALLLAGLAGVTGSALQRGDTGRENVDLNREAQFALARIARLVERAPGLVLPLADDPATGQTENIHTALAVLLPRDLDQDDNGRADVDNDGDGRIDEDLPGDMNKDGQPGIAGIDDNLDGTVDNGQATSSTASDDDDESMTGYEDPCDGVDNDGDASIDEDCSADMSGELWPGLKGVDDDGDGTVDDSCFWLLVWICPDLTDDDEDGAKDEDWQDTVVFHLEGGQLKERLPVPWDANADGKVDGKDVVTSVLAENVSQFRVERLPRDNGRAQVVEITLTLSGAKGATATLKTRLRVGGGL